MEPEVRRFVYVMFKIRAIKARLFALDWIACKNART